MASSSQFPEIVVVGSCMIDFVSYSQRLPKAGETIMGKKFVTNFGGKGANQCIQASRLGTSTALVARLGNDIWGDRYIENLKKEKVDTTYVKKTDEVDSGIAQITVAEPGQGHIVIIGGANEKLSEKDVADAKDFITNAKVLVLQLEIPMETVIAAMKLCKNTSILNGAPATTTYQPELLKLPTIFCVNETETETFSGLPVGNIEEAKVAAKKLLSKGCNSVLMTLGERGCVYANNKGEMIHCPTVEVEPVDTTGAGDSFIGAVAVLLARKKDLPMLKILEIASYVAADSVTRPGSQKSFPDKKILQKFKLDL